MSCPSYILLFSYTVLPYCSVCAQWAIAYVVYVLYVTLYFAGSVVGLTCDGHDVGATTCAPVHAAVSRRRGVGTGAIAGAGHDRLQLQDTAEAGFGLRTAETGGTRHKSQGISSFSKLRAHADYLIRLEPRTSILKIVNQSLSSVLALGTFTSTSAAQSNAPVSSSRTNAANGRAVKS